jgi:hypothetical protein
MQSSWGRGRVSKPERPEYWAVIAWPSMKGRKAVRYIYRKSLKQENTAVEWYSDEGIRETSWCTVSGQDSNRILPDWESSSLPFGVKIMAWCYVLPTEVIIIDHAVKELGVRKWQSPCLWYTSESRAMETLRSHRHRQFCWSLPVMLVKRALNVKFGVLAPEAVWSLC